ncbi:MAG TPA: YbaK/EbsC family protein [Anaerolineales bacterium]|nr:YbaK/EbsC family protein [Anaerolineales bacterium]
MTTPLLTPSDLQAYMQAQGIPGKILLLETPTPTVEIAAQVVSAQPDQIIKSILFTVDEEPVLAIACGTAYIDRAAIARLYNVGKKRVRLAAPETVLAVSGYAVGAMPPFGHRRPLPTLIDARVLGLATAYAGGGGENALLRLDPQDILRHTQGTVMDLSCPPSETE